MARLAAPEGPPLPLHPLTRPLAAALASLLHGCAVTLDK